MSTQTETSVATITSVLSNTVTVTAIAITQTIFEVKTSTVPADPPATVYVTADVNCTPPAVAVKRVATVAKPSGLAAYTVAAAISSACKCLSVPTSTTTEHRHSDFHANEHNHTDRRPDHNHDRDCNAIRNRERAESHATATAYALPDQAPCKIQTNGDAGACLYLSSAPFDNPYTFGGSGNVFHYVPDVGFGPFGLRDDTLGYPTVYDANGPVLPLRRGSGFNLVCSIQSVPGDGQ
ncbi:hypothetical protein Q7P35_009676 [Cladosporium inversicolor]